MQGGSLMESNFPGMIMPSMCLEGQVDGNREQYQQPWQFDLLHQPAWAREEDNTNFITPQNSLLSYDSSAHSGNSHFHNTSFLLFFLLKLNKSFGLTIW